MGAETLYDHIFSEDGTAGRVYVTKVGRQMYVVDSFSIDGNK